MDIFSKSDRSKIMKRVKSTGNASETKLRKRLFALGFRYRVNYSMVPGKPDIVFTRKRKVIFVHGCFWHQHAECKASDRPTSNTEYWTKKLDGNVARDLGVQDQLRETGWTVYVVWECELKNFEECVNRVTAFLSE